MEINFDKLIRLHVAGLVRSNSRKDYNAIILEEEGGDRRIQIVIGLAEAQSIECAIRKIMAHRPLTHDLMCNIMNIYGINIFGIIINLLPEGIYSGKILLSPPSEAEENTNIIVDSRSSDAIALAIRFNAPIFTSPELLDKIGVHTTDVDNEFIMPQITPNATPLHINFSEIGTDDNPEKKSLPELQKMLTEAIEEERYEDAAKIKDEIGRRNNDSQTSPK